MVGKLEHRQEDALSLPAGSTGSALIYLHDVLSNRRFLVDTGASISVFPAPASSTSSGVQLLTANGSTLSCSGSRIILYVLEHGIVHGLFSWLQFLFLSLEQIFSSIMTSV